MAEFISNNPFVILCGFFLCTPGILPVLLAFYIGRRGLPFSFRWTGYKATDI